MVFIDSDGALVRVGPGGMRGRVYIRNAAGQWELSANAVTIPEGWFSGPMREKP